MTTYECKDGTPFHVNWVEPGDERDTWVFNRAHWPMPFTPMGVAIEEAGKAGRARAYSEATLEPIPPFRYFLFVNGFQYTCQAPASPEVQAGYAAFRAAHGGTLRGLWDDFCEPRFKQAVAEIIASDQHARVADLANTYLYGYHQSFSSMGAVLISVRILNALLAEAYGPQAPLVAQELVQGGESATLAIDEEIGSLAALARANDGITAALAAPGWSAFRERIQQADGGPAFAERLDELLERHGQRSTSWELLDPTWGERPEVVLDLVRSLASAETGSMAEKARQSTAARAARLAELDDRLSPEEAETARRLVHELDGYVHVREGRAYLQMVIVGAMRHALLRIGGRLHDAGFIDDAHDVFFLLATEADAAHPGDLRRVVAERRAEWERWCAIAPPDFVGAPPPVPAQAPVATAGELRGVGASRGTVTAHARILADANDGHLLGAGEILVCVMTTPAWTSLFALAGAVITETGAPLSHPAIAAREYGIPCVVAVSDATKLIPDGAMVEVDGAKGTVRILA